MVKGPWGDQITALTLPLAPGGSFFRQIQSDWFKKGRSWQLGKQGLAKTTMVMNFHFFPNTITPMSGFARKVAKFQIFGDQLLPKKTQISIEQDGRNVPEIQRKLGKDQEVKRDVSIAQSLNLPISTKVKRSLVWRIQTDIIQILVHSLIQHSRPCLVLKGGL